MNASSVGLIPVWRGLRVWISEIIGLLKLRASRFTTLENELARLTRRTKQQPASPHKSIRSCHF